MASSRLPRSLQAVSVFHSKSHIMNRTIIFSTLCFLFISVGCGKDFLEKKPLGKLTAENFFETEAHAVLATDAVYEHMRDWLVHVFSYIGMTDVISDDSDKGSFPNDAAFLLELDNLTFTPNNTAPAGVWEGYYQGIFRANLVINNIPDIEMDEDLKERLIAECKFIRGYFYFNLVRWFGDVPLILTELSSDEFKQERTPIDIVYNQIILDMQEAIEVLPEKSQYASSDLGRVTKGTARGMLAKVYLTLGDFVQTERLTKEVIESGEYELYPQFAQLFTLDGENSSESIFEIQATEGRINSSQFNQVQGVRGTPNLGWGFNSPSDDLITSFERGDPRRDATVLYPGEQLPDGSAIVEDNPDLVNERYNQKGWAPQTASGDNFEGQGNIRVLRYADVLLMAAEALNENGKSQDALTYLNMVRTRARGNRPPTILPDIDETGKDALRTIIWNERRSELAMEQHRWFDLQRQGRAEEVMIAHGKNYISPRHDLFPIPQTEIDVSGNSLEQNPGW